MSLRFRNRLLISVCGTGLLGFWAPALGQVQFFGISPGDNGNNAAQALELRIAPGQNLWGEQSPGSGSRAELAYYDAAGTEYLVFPFPEDVPQDLSTADVCGLTSVLVATQAFSDLYGLAADVTLPPAEGNTLLLMHSESGAVCFRGTDNPGAPAINICVSYGTLQLCAISGNCCVDDATCTEPGDLCVLAPAMDNGKIPFTASIFGHQNGFNGTVIQGLSGCPTVAAPLTGVTALQRMEPVGPGCCQDEDCHRNSDFPLTTGPTWKNAAGNTASLPVASTLEQGEALFRTAHFNGNLRNCMTCHLPQDGFGLRPESVSDLFATNPLDALFAAENIPAIAALETPCLMRQGDQRALITENVLGNPPAFRNSMPLVNIQHTGPFGWSPCFGGSGNLRDFGQTAVHQHFPRVLPRNIDPNTGVLLSNRPATLEELTLMEEFQFSIKTAVNDGLGDLKGPLDGACSGGTDDGRTCGPCLGNPPQCPTDQCPGGTCVSGTSEQNREDNLDRLIAEFVAFCPSANAQQIADGRQRFQDAGCMICHNGPFLGAADIRATGLVDHPSNADTGCPLGCAGAACALVNEDVLCDQCGAQCPGCDGNGCAQFGAIEFDVRPLVDVARTKSGIADPALGIFGHDGSLRTLREAVEFYQTPASRVPIDPSTSAEIDDIVAFLSALVEVGDPSVCPPPLPVPTCAEIRRFRARCRGTGTVEILVILDNNLHDGQSVTVAVNGSPTEIVIAGRRAFEAVCCVGGQISVTIESPAQCVDPLELLCPELPPFGACCGGDGVCNLGSESDCDSLGGLYQGDDTVCSPNPCPQPATGACCDPDGTCAITTESNCTGTYQGDDTVCSPNPCPPPGFGACCAPDETCTITTEADCSGVYRGDDTACEPAICAPSPGPTCADVRRLRARCSDDGKVTINVVLDNHNHNGAIVTVAIDGETHTVTVVDRFALLNDCCHQGQRTITLEEPANCIDPVIVDCP